MLVRGLPLQMCVLSIHRKLPVVEPGLPQVAMHATKQSARRSQVFAGIRDFVVVPGRLTDA